MVVLIDSFDGEGFDSCHGCGEGCQGETSFGIQCSSNLWHGVRTWVSAMLGCHFDACF